MPAATLVSKLVIASTGKAHVYDVEADRLHCGQPADWHDPTDEDFAAYAIGAIPLCGVCRPR